VTLAAAATAATNLVQVLAAVFAGAADCRCAQVASLVRIGSVGNHFAVDCYSVGSLAAVGAAVGAAVEAAVEAAVGAAAVDVTAVAAQVYILEVDFRDAQGEPPTCSSQP